MSLWTGIVTCSTCKAEINRAEHVPEEDKARAGLTAAFGSLCKVRSHNTFSDLNWNYTIQWVEEIQS